MEKRMEWAKDCLKRLLSVQRFTSNTVAMSTELNLQS